MEPGNHRSYRENAGFWLCPSHLALLFIDFFTHSIKTYTDLIVLRSIQSRNKPSQAYHPSYSGGWSKEASQLQNLFGLHSEFKAGLGDFLRSCLKAKTKTWAGTVAQSRDLLSMNEAQVLSPAPKEITLEP